MYINIKSSYQTAVGDSDAFHGILKGSVNYVTIQWITLPLSSRVLSHACTGFVYFFISHKKVICTECACTFFFTFIPWCAAKVVYKETRGLLTLLLSKFHQKSQVISAQNTSELSLWRVFGDTTITSSSNLSPYEKKGIYIKFW